MSLALWASVLAPAAPWASAQTTPAKPSPSESLTTLRRDLGALEQELATARSRMLEVPEARIVSDLATARMALDTATLMSEMRDDPLRSESWLLQAREAMLAARVRLTPSRTVEARGIFLDAGALPKTPEGVRTLLSTLSKAGFNLIYPEVFRRGYTLYPSRLTEQDPEFSKSPDLLKVLVSEAHALGMEVHPWIWTLRVRSPGFGNPVLDRLPGLASREVSASETPPRFLSAAEPRARQWVGMLVDEMFSRYGFDGLMLDYVRYDETIPEDESSRTYFALDYFAKYGQYPPYPVPPNSQAAAEWQSWREEQVNLLVKEVSERLKRKNPRLTVSASTFRGESFARLTKMQHWRHWSNNRWVNVVTSMLYTSKTEDLATWLSWETDGYKRPNLLYPILGPLRMNDASWESVSQIRLLQQKNQPGVLFFAMSHMRPALLAALSDGPFRRKAMVPHRNPALGAKRVLQELDGGYLRHLIANGDFELSASARALSLEVQALSSMIPNRDVPFTGSAPVISRMDEFKTLTAGLVAGKQLPGAIAQELNERMAYAQSLMRANAHDVTVRGFIPSTRPPIEVKVDRAEVRD
jgi:uncharacterized lipoprotein YddW (UPF0748 family)